MKIRAICRADAKILPGKTSKTGIFKHPVQGPVLVDREGIVSDAVCNKKHHGGPDQALYVMGSVDLDFWSRELGFAVEPGFFGENLVIDGIDSARMHVGDRLTAAEVELEVTAARIPCATLTARVGDANFAPRFRQAGQPGFYCRVLKGGMIAAEEAVTFAAYHGTKLPIPVILQRFRPSRLSQAERDDYLTTPLASRFRAMLQG
ncbi:MOSC domain-containing protein [Agrobacterium rubi]|uniref:MOSC domain-containing protein n=1 Tax=Agrobacterium rubi TaxID=28099 RepID=A0AAE7UR48_9HYPH|nr:MOSC domain-containing protein [Agrobacterium rubi]NTE84993.1 MOSC domain-containing protein [Agrobacterium rubi]NTF00925.1 MOSC domain-containing protein [Agrobacterium rubi]NTF35113.1 MOSC domain-containing protein [Agrobacterium rubi]OCJ48849.1 molybdenum cofactor biosysynthesis protein [Agrobacterium rubi]QTG00325.1 MOSC domain-containing protein [Agrobacterium rubi]